MEAVRNGYAQIGVENYYIKHANDYSNPHELVVHKLLGIAKERNYIEGKVLDLCCGSGEVTRGLKQYNHEVVGVDPYTIEAYYKRVGKRPVNLSFKDIIQGKLQEKFDSIVCSFALHLCEESMLPTLLWKLGEISNTLIVITPHKKPNCDNISSWMLVDEIIVDRVRMRIYLR